MRVEHWWYAIPLWLRGLVRRRDVERDLDDEIRDHIERQTAENIARGIRPDEARRAALVAFGGVERVKDESRDARRLSLVDDMAQVRYATRSLWRSRVFTVATVTTIALGIGAACAVLAMVNAVLRPLPYSDSNRLVALWHAFPGIGMPLVAQSPGTYLSYHKSAKSLESVGAYADVMATVAHGTPGAEPERLPVAWVTPSIFSILRARPVIGRLFTDADGDERGSVSRVAVIGERFWRTRLAATPAVIGQRIRVNEVDREIVGVLPESFAFPGSAIQLWTPVGITSDAYLGTFGFRAIGRMRPGVSLNAAQAELQQILMRTPETYAEQRPGVSTARLLEQTKAIVVVHFLRDDAIGGFDRILWLVGATVAVLLLVAFSNVASLVLARVEARQREFAVRSALGASAGRIWWSLVTESAIVSVAGGIIGLGLAAAALTSLARTGATELLDPRLSNAGRVVVPRLNEIHPDWTLGLSALALTSLFCLVSGIVGTWRVTSADPIRVLRDGGRWGTSGRASQRLRAAFVVVEVSLSLVLLTSSAVLGRSLLRLLDVQPGFDPGNVVTFWTSPPRSYRTPADIARLYREAVDRIERIPGVVSAGVVSKVPLQSGQTGRIVWVENAPSAAGVLPPSYPIVEASDGYFRAMGIPLVAGRVFDVANVRRGENEAVVGRSFVAQQWGDSTGRRGLGRRFRPYAIGPWYTVVGVVGDVRDTSLTAPPATVLYLPEEPGVDSVVDTRPSRNMAFVVRTRGALPGLAATLEREIHALDPNVPVYDMTSMKEIMGTAGSRMTFALLLLGVGAAATLALGIVGLYGVIAYVVGQRSREIGIRIALGLTPNGAALMILRQGEAIVVAGTVLGLLVFLAFAKLLRSLVFDISVVDGTALAAAGATVFVVASLATWLPARRAARIDPAEALKSD